MLDPVRRFTGDPLIDDDAARLFDHLKGRARQFCFPGRIDLGKQHFSRFVAHRDRDRRMKCGRYGKCNLFRYRIPICRRDLF